MDHLPYPNIPNLPNLRVPPIVVPYLSGYEYDGEDFATFPERVGFWKDGTLDLDQPCRQLAALAQGWLFFGLIDIFTRQRVDKGLLIRREDNDDVVDTTALGGIVEKSVRPWQTLFLRSKVLAGIRPQRMEAPRAIRTQLMEAARASSALDRIQVDDSPSSAVFLSIKILIVYLSEMFDVAFTLRLDPGLSPIPLRDSFRSPILETRKPDQGVAAPTRLLMDRMSKSGWCIHQITDVCRVHNYCTVYYYSSIARVESWEDITHQACTEAKCVAYNIKDNSAYKIRHTEECSGCELVGPPEDEVADIVKNGDIPLIELSPASLENQTQLAVRSATAHSRYTAISHVWIDGHGNPTASTLPRCQLQRLTTRLSAISNAKQARTSRLWQRLRKPSSTSHLLWMDTLCIPPQRDSEDQKFLRKKAIHRMTLTYVGAEQVLVLDAELDKFIHEGSPQELTDALISCSRWNGRGWTLEEGALARKCFFHFKDVARGEARHKRSTLRDAMTLLALQTWFSIRNFLFYILLIRMPHNPYLWGRLWQMSPNVAHNYLRYELELAAVRSAQRDISHAPQEDKFMRTWNGIGRRSTTRPEDIHPIMANLTDFSAAQIMELETPVLRTKMIAHCIGKFPLDMLWTPCARPQANEDSADRWVPSIPGPEPLEQRVKLRSTGKGLVVDTENRWKPPMTFSIRHGMVDSRFCFRWPQNDDEEEHWYVVECMIAEDDALPRDASETAVLILSPNPTGEGSTAVPLVRRGARLLVTKSNPSTPNSLHLRYDCPLICTIQSHPPDSEQIHEIPDSRVDRESRSKELVIESTFDQEDRKKLHMRRRDLYYGHGIPYKIGDVNIPLSVVTVLLLLLFFLYAPGYTPLISTVITLLILFGLKGIYALLIVPWENARAYNAWKATFEEDWRPKDSFVRRFVKAIHLPRRRKRTDQEEELVNV